jgi:hypothetical protein
MSYSFKDSLSIPNVTLNSVSVLKEEKENWSEVLQNMNIALNEMRVDWDSGVIMKDIKDSKNSLLDRRRKKNAMKSLKLNEQPIAEEDENQRIPHQAANALDHSMSKNNTDQNYKKANSTPHPVTALHYSINLKENKPSKDLFPK